MDEIIKKLEEMGVKANPKAVKGWLRDRNQSIETVDDSAIFAMAEAFAAAIAPSVENLPAGWDKVEGGLEAPPAEETIESIAEKDAAADVELVLSQYQSAYKRVFSAKIRSLATFRSEYRNQAAALLSA